MKKITSIIAVSAVAVLLAPICFADSATLYNATNYSCSGYPVDMTKCIQSVSGVTIQPRDAQMQPAGSSISVGNSGSAPIVKMPGQIPTILATTPNQAMAAYQGTAKAGGAYHMVTAPDVGGYWMSDQVPVKK